MFTNLSITKILTFEIRANTSAFTDNGSRWKFMYLHCEKILRIAAKSSDKSHKILTKWTTFRCNITHAINGTQEICLIDPSFYWLGCCCMWNSCHVVLYLYRQCKLKLQLMLQWIKISREYITFFCSVSSVSNRWSCTAFVIAAICGINNALFIPLAKPQNIINASLRRQLIKIWRCFTILRPAS